MKAAMAAMTTAAATVSDREVEMQGLDESSQSSAMSICSSNATPVSQTTSSQKSTCLKRKKKSRSRAAENEKCAFNWLETTSDDRDDEITKRLNFDDLELSDDNDEVEKKTESAKKRRASIKEGARPSSDTKSRRSSVVQPIRNTCILESPMHPRKSSRKRRIYGVRRNEPQLTRKRPKRTPKRPVTFALCVLQRMFAGQQ